MCFINLVQQYQMLVLKKNSPKVISNPSQICNKVSNFINSVLPLIKVEIVEQGIPDILHKFQTFIFFALNKI